MAAGQIIKATCLAFKVLKITQGFWPGRQACSHGASNEGTMPPKVNQTKKNILDMAQHVPLHPGRHCKVSTPI